MIRAALISLVFLGITLTLILMQPGANHSTDTASIEIEAPVTRAQTEIGTLEDNLDEVLATATLATEIEFVANLAKPEFIAEPVRTDPQPLIEPSQPATLKVPETPLEELIVSALKQGQSTRYIDALVNDAAEQGEVDVPASLVTQDGRVDTALLLSALSTPSRKTVPAVGSAKSYRVQPGDSLASIAYRYYGSTDRAVDIYSANLSILNSPNHVEVGQTLVIPVP